eukprot:TRINITY_DN5620_c0_g1_i1.p1 TRINITY_DN5620_c0_g1~~TRINITY_DN5620_c0_g1_i1.p1  ORF type:complete len:997 (-),score=194.94 TRINITY_DN5620_c0_g1_i1:60-3050(-)
MAVLSDTMLSSWRLPQVSASLRPPSKSSNLRLLEPKKGTEAGVYGHGLHAKRLSPKLTRRMPIGSKNQLELLSVGVAVAAGAARHHRRSVCSSKVTLRARSTETTNLAQEEQPVLNSQVNGDDADQLSIKHDSDLMSWVQAITDRIDQLDGISLDASSGRLPTSSTEAGLSARTELEQLSESSTQTEVPLASLLLSKPREEDGFTTWAMGKITQALETGSTGAESIGLDSEHVGSQHCLKRASEMPPPLNDSTTGAKAARYPAIAALRETPKDALAGLGVSESALASGNGLALSRPKSRSLEEILKELTKKWEKEWIVGENSIEIEGITDMVGLVKPGDLIVLPKSSPLEFSHDLLVSALKTGAVAAAFCLQTELSDELLETSKKLLEEFRSYGLKAIAVLPANSASDSNGMSSTAAFLAQSFFDRPSEKLKKLVAVVGDKADEVRSTAWLLSTLFESSEGAEKSGLLSSRRTLRGFESINCSGLPLTPCCVQELFAGMVESGVDACVVEVLPEADSDAFHGLDFDLVVDLSSKASGLNANCKARSQILKKVERKRVVSDDSEWLSFDIEKLRYKTNDSEWLSFDIEKLRYKTMAQLKEMAREVGILKVSGIKKSDLIAALEPHLQTQASQEASNAIMAPSSDCPTFQNMLRGRILPIVGAAGLSKLELDLELQIGNEMVMKRAVPPLWGRGGAKSATAAVCAQLTLAKLQASESEGVDLQEMQQLLEECSSTLTGVSRPPGTLELFTAVSAAEASAKDPLRVIGILHQASSAQEVRHTLEEVRDWIAETLGEEDEVPTITAVFGCSGEVGRGDRAKCGWALAELADRVVLTSHQPRGEPAMQVIEDVLEAINARFSSSSTMPVQEVHVIADRTDAVKFAALQGTPRPRPGKALSPGIVVFFGSSEEDFQEVAHEDGQVCRWLCNDRRLFLESLQLAEDLSRRCNDKVYIQDVPWSFSVSKDGGGARKKVSMQLPGNSLHWTYKVGLHGQDIIEGL